MYRNQIKESVLSGRFLYTLEYVPEMLTELDRMGLPYLEQEAARLIDDERIGGVNIGDRVKSMDSLNTVDCGRKAADASGKMPLLHLAGKNRTFESAKREYLRAFEQGLNTFLVVTGDRVFPEEEKSVVREREDGDRSGNDRIRYFDSVDGIRLAKSLNSACFLAAGVAPFKYREEELLNQYLKMVKKLRAGADYLVTNCGWDMDKYQELIWYRNARGYDTPIVANLLMPAMGWARGIHSRRLPGVFMSDDLFRKIEEEHTQDKAEGRRKRLNRLALQIVGVKLMGFAGVQLSGVETYSMLTSVIEDVAKLEKELTDLDSWKYAWRKAHTFEDGSVVAFGPEQGLYLFDEPPDRGSLVGPPRVDGVVPSASELQRFRILDTVDRKFFHKNAVGASLLSAVVRGMSSVKPGLTFLKSAEHAIKSKTLGCEMCGYCRIPYLFYSCPETCPKGLANGPCAGTDENTCEFKDRECIHNRKYRIAKALGRLDELESIAVPPVRGSRGESSWLNQYTDNIPDVEVLTDGRKNPVRKHHGTTVEIKPIVDKS